MSNHLKYRGTDLQTINTVQLNLSIMDTLEPNQKCADYQLRCSDFPSHFYMIKHGPFGTSTKCVDYAGVLIFKCPHLQASMYTYVSQ